jgi:predicted Rossmann fold flavoprotein
VPKDLTKCDVVVLGAGGAGLMVSAIAGQRGRKVVLLDHVEAAGKKILISGGGRCNFTNLNTGPENFISANPHFAKSALQRYRPTDFIRLVEAYKIAWHEKTLGQLFCDNSAKNIVAMLLDQCNKGRVELVLSSPVADISHSDGVFTVIGGKGTYQAKSLVVATGGPSIPKMGATGFAYEIARKFGHKVVEPKPALVPLTLGPNEALFKELSGVSSDIIAISGKTKFREAALFTHKGLSGPAILQISSFWRHGEAVGINFLPDVKEDWLLASKRSNPKSEMRATLARVLPDRLAEALAAKIHLNGELANISDRKLEGAARRLANWQFLPTGTEGFAKAEVTLGGVSTDSLSSQSMESKKVPGLYFIGEALDVTGWLGGYNFQWAWASGSACGNAL